jgi:hypothetical protein
MFSRKWLQLLSTSLFNISITKNWKLIFFLRNLGYNKNNFEGLLKKYLLNQLLPKKVLIEIW